MLDRLLEAGSVFDWISPLIAGIQDLASGPTHTFLVPDDCGWSGYEIAGLLRDHGVKTWGLMIVDHTLLVTVRMAQARWAQYLLLREGIPLEQECLDRRTGHKTGSVRQSQRPNSASTLDRWLDSLDEWLQR